MSGLSARQQAALLLLTPGGRAEALPAEWSATLKAMSRGPDPLVRRVYERLGDVRHDAAGKPRRLRRASERKGGAKLAVAGMPRRLKFALTAGGEAARAEAVAQRRREEEEQRRLQRVPLAEAPA